MPHAHITKIEDARTGQWLRHLDPITDPIKRIDMGWTMGDWNQLDVTTETVGLRESYSDLLLPSSFFLRHLFAVLALIPPLAIFFPSSLGIIHSSCLTYTVHLPPTLL
jgi:hypothetical protein